MNITPGTYTAKVKSYQIGLHEKTGTPIPKVQFEFADNVGETQTIVMHMYMTQQSNADITIKNLITLGLNGDVLDLCGGLQSGKHAALDTTKEVSIVIENENYDGKTTAKVKYINEVGDAGPGFGKVLDNVSCFNGISFKGDILRIKQELATGAVTTPQTQTKTNFDPNEKLDF